ncbi:ATP-binding cassette domain-containing protein [Cohnella fermenti]|nr:ATP-binding cassette domain-containing protein [Cohnella fermenti]
MTSGRDSHLVCRFDSAGTEGQLILQTGRIHVLLGKNGAGKTHWIESLAGLLPSAGMGVRFGDEPLWRAGARGRIVRNPQALRAYAYATQAPEDQLAHRTVEEELAETLKPYSLPPEEVRERIVAALRAVGWSEDWLARSPFLLSGGEKRRLALACLLAAPCDWLLLDEPTSGLDAPGQEALQAQLRLRAAEGQGILLISHDTEWALPLADRVLLLSAGGERVRECSPEELLGHPEWWEEAGLPVPEWLQAIAPLLKRGVPASLVWSPRDLARAAAKREAETEDLSPGSSSVVRRRGTSAAREQRRRIARTPLLFFDPRALWLVYVILSIAILAQRSWWGVAAGGAIAAAGVAFGRIPLGRWRGVLVGFLLFTLTVSVVAGIGRSAGGEWGFQVGAFLTALHSMARTFLVLLLGLGLAVAITPLRLRRSLESLFAYRGRIAPILQKFLLTVALMLRFIPVFLSEWERFSRYAIARGKESGRRRSVPGLVKRIGRIATPFLFSLFRLGDQAAIALESRGVGRVASPTIVKLGRWTAKDWGLVIIAVSLAAALWLVRGLGA